MKTIILFFLNFYMNYISPLFPPRCRFYPSCSRYSYSAFEQYGIIKGFYLSIARVIRCHPFHPGGVDLLPDLQPREFFSPSRKHGSRDAVKLGGSDQ